ncbi:MAG: LysR family transcriptional regulator, partial [Shewanella sp.]
EIDFVGGSRYQFIPQLVSTLERPLGRAGKLFTALILEEFAKAEQFNGIGLG